MLDGWDTYSVATTSFGGVSGLKLRKLLKNSFETRRLGQNNISTVILRCTLMYQLPIKAPVPWVIASFRAALRPPLQESQKVESCAEVLLGITCNGPKTIPHTAIILIVGEGDSARKKRLALTISIKVKPHFIGKRVGQ